MTIEAMWTVRFGPQGVPEGGLNGGVAMLETGRLFGGDSVYAYVGRYKVAGKSISGDLRIIRHEFETGESMYGTEEQEFMASFSGQLLTDRRIVGLLDRSGYPSAQLVMSRLAELP